MAGPGQLELNEFEVSILRHIARESSSIAELIPQLRVLSREFTGVGSFTNLDCPNTASDLGNRTISLQALINMPDLSSGMGAVLFCENGQPKCLETFTFGSEHWEGVYDGFSISENT